MKYFFLLLMIISSFAVRAEPASDGDQNVNKANVRDNLQTQQSQQADTIATGDANEINTEDTRAVKSETVETRENKIKSDESQKDDGTKKQGKKSNKVIREKWGVDDFIVRHTSAGYMLDVRFRVYDKDKAKPLFDRKLRPFAIAEESGNKFGVPASPKVGFLRQAPQHIENNKQYFLMIANPGKRFKTGDKLTLVIGDFRAPHLTVE